MYSLLKLFLIDKNYLIPMYYIGFSGGTSLDFYAESNIPLVFNVELPDLGESAFFIPASEIPSVS